MKSVQKVFVTLPRQFQEKVNLRNCKEYYVYGNTSHYCNTSLFIHVLIYFCLYLYIYIYIYMSGITFAAGIAQSV
jgi:hypothetical protein